MPTDRQVRRVINLLEREKIVQAEHLYLQVSHMMELHTFMQVLALLEDEETIHYDDRKHMVMWLGVNDNRKSH